MPASTCGNVNAAIEAGPLESDMGWEVVSKRGRGKKVTTQTTMPSSKPTLQDESSKVASKLAAKDSDAAPEQPEDILCKAKDSVLPEAVSSPSPTSTCFSQTTPGSQRLCWADIASDDEWDESEVASTSPGPSSTCSSQMSPASDKRQNWADVMSDIESIPGSDEHGGHGSTTECVYSPSFPTAFPVADPTEIKDASSASPEGLEPYPYVTDARSWSQGSPDGALSDYTQESVAYQYGDAVTIWWQPAEADASCNMDVYNTTTTGSHIDAVQMPKPRRAPKPKNEAHARALAAARQYEQTMYQCMNNSTWSSTWQAATDDSEWQPAADDSMWQASTADSEWQAAADDSMWQAAPAVPDDSMWQLAADGSTWQGCYTSWDGSCDSADGQAPTFYMAA